MAQLPSHPVPGKILQSDFFMGLGFEQLLAVASTPMIVLTVALVIQQIPIVVGLVFSIGTMGGLVLLAARAPEGQSPFQWAAAAFRRRLTPQTYRLKPETGPSPRPVYLNVVHTMRADDTPSSPTRTSTPASPSRERQRGSSNQTGGTSLADTVESHLNSGEDKGVTDFGYFQFSSRTEALEAIVEVNQDPELSRSEKKEEVQTLVEMAQQAGISLRADEVRTAIEKGAEGMPPSTAAEAAVHSGSA